MSEPHIVMALPGVTVTIDHVTKRVIVTPSEDNVWDLVLGTPSLRWRDLHGRHARCQLHTSVDAIDKTQWRE